MTGLPSRIVAIWSSLSVLPSIAGDPRIVRMRLMRRRCEFSPSANESARPSASPILMARVDMAGLTVQGGGAGVMRQTLRQSFRRHCPCKRHRRKSGVPCFDRPGCRRMGQGSRTRPQTTGSATASCSPLSFRKGWPRWNVHCFLVENQDILSSCAADEDSPVVRVSLPPWSQRSQAGRSGCLRPFRALMPAIKIDWSSASIAASIVFPRAVSSAGHHLISSGVD